MIKFNSPYEPIRIKPDKTDKRTISGDYLDYNEYGKVVIKHGNEIDIMAISEAAKEGTELAEQIASMIKNDTLQTAQLNEKNCGDVSEAPNTVTEMLQQSAQAKRQAEALDSQKLKEEYGLSGKELARLSNEEINTILSAYIERKAKENGENGKQ